MHIFVANESTYKHAVSTLVTHISSGQKTTSLNQLFESFGIVGDDSSSLVWQQYSNLWPRTNIHSSSLSCKVCNSVNAIKQVVYVKILNKTISKYLTRTLRAKPALILVFTFGLIFLGPDSNCGPFSERK